MIRNYKALFTQKICSKDDGIIFNSLLIIFFKAAIQYLLRQMVGRKQVPDFIFCGG